MREQFKDVTIGGQEFRVGLLPAHIGTWAVAQMSAGRAITDPDTYLKLQGHILERCSIYREADGNRVPMKIYESGRWLVKSLEYELETIHDLCMAAMDFNFDPFFEKKKAEAESRRKAEEAALTTSQ